MKIINCLPPKVRKLSQDWVHPYQALGLLSMA